MSLRDIFSTKRSPVFLPYQKVSNDFCAKCSGECVSECQEEIIIKKEGGIPYLSFEASGCVFCKKCAEICSKTYGKKSVLDPKREDRINAFAKIDMLSCLAYNKIICSSCKDACSGSIQFVGMLYPEVLDTCTGCGLCVSRCPKNSISIVAEI